MEILTTVGEVQMRSMQLYLHLLDKLSLLLLIIGSLKFFEIFLEFLVFFCKIFWIFCLEIKKIC